jgi:hypothetical protein
MAGRLWGRIELDSALERYRALVRGAVVRRDRADAVGARLAANGYVLRRRHDGRARMDKRA